MYKLMSLFVLCGISLLGASAQETKPSPAPTPAPKMEEKKVVTAVSNEMPKVTIKADATPLELAKAAIQAHGGDNFLKMKSLIMRGSVDVTSSAFPTAIAGTFAQIFVGDKYRLQINAVVFNFLQTYDGAQTNSSMGAFTLPPLNRLGLPMLARIDDKSFTVSALADKKKKGFRITSPEDFYTDYFIDDKTGQVKSYEASYEMNGRKVTTSVENDKFKMVEGVLVPERFSQRFDVGEITAYSDFKAKEILVNTDVANDVFAPTGK